ncbi:MAG TPA: hypothetical protein VF624_19285 [Tepidisphaeraceae bacterium]
MTEPKKEQSPENTNDAGMGAGDGNSGGGNATGAPDGDTAMRSDAEIGGDVETDRAKLFPQRGQGSSATKNK